MTEPEISTATAEEREWAAGMLSISEPWTTLGLTRELCFKTCTDPEFHVFVARIHQKPCGVMVLDPRGLAGSPYIKSIAIAPEWRSQRIGEKLLLFTENFVRTQANNIFLCVSSFNHRARNFYHAHGYQVVGELKDYLISGESEMILHKRL